MLAVIAFMKGIITVMRSECGSSYQPYDPRGRTQLIAGTPESRLDRGSRKAATGAALGRPAQYHSHVASLTVAPTSFLGILTVSDARSIRGAAAPSDLSDSSARPTDALARSCVQEKAHEVSERHEIRHAHELHSRSQIVD
jgi:hypothetical protein